MKEFHSVMYSAIALLIFGLSACSELENDPKKPFTSDQPSAAAGQFNTTEFTLDENRARYMRTKISGSSSGSHTDWFSLDPETTSHGFVRNFTYRFTDERWLAERVNKKQVGDSSLEGDIVLFADTLNKRVSLSLRAVPNGLKTNEEYNAYKADLTQAPYRCVEYATAFDKDGLPADTPQVWVSEAVFNPEGTGRYVYFNRSGLLEQNRGPRDFAFTQGSPGVGGIGALLISDQSARQRNPLEPAEPVLQPGRNLDENYFAEVLSSSAPNCGSTYLVDSADDAGEGNGLERRVDQRPAYCNVAAYGGATTDGAVLFATRQFFEASANRAPDTAADGYMAPATGLRPFQSEQVCVRTSSDKSAASVEGAWWLVNIYSDAGTPVITFGELILNAQGLGESRQINVTGNVAPRTTEVEFLVEPDGVLNFGGGLGAVNEAANFMAFDASDAAGRHGIGLAIRQTLPPPNLSELLGKDEGAVTANE